ncbi:hypothetical protein McanMca71_004635 [Microsporum canis]|uniref:Uncharacterized protein n=1 Tax=Arthroderma otae (strain ATCC MYA-4605 / CBS 113480) TaxID=554155 RepID=C5FUL0_ARTOC|nr:conserved hypothetical protein [Microsporum canis CBS 113480]EEQ33594.1 conserved hypothetical protein [Microsporum canis CBS 113480]
MTNRKDMGYGWFAKARFEAKKALEEEYRHPRAAAWTAYWEDVRNGTVKKQLYPILITKSGPFTSPQALQEIAGLPSPPEVISSVRLRDYEIVPPAEPREEDKVQYCVVENFFRIKNLTYGEWEDFRKACRTGALLDTTYPIIISSSGPFTSPEKIQEVLGLLELPEVKETTRTSLSVPVKTFESNEEKVQYCAIDLGYLGKIEEYSEGEDIVVWVQFEHRCAWLAHSVKSKVEDQNIKDDSGGEAN